MEWNTSILWSKHSSGDLEWYITWSDKHALTWWELCTGELLNMSQDLATMGKHDLRIKVLNKGN